MAESESLLQGSKGSEATAEAIPMRESECISEPLTPSVQIRLDAATILIDDAINLSWEDRPSMVDTPELYYLFVVHNWTRRLPQIASYILIIVTVMGKPFWCEGEHKCSLGSYPTMLTYTTMWPVKACLHTETACIVVTLSALYIERLHRGDNVYNLRSPKAQLLWAKIAIAVLYLVDLALSYAYIDTSYLKWRLGGYLRALLFTLLHRSTLAIWDLHIKMMPHFFEVIILIGMFITFYSVLAMNVFQEGEEGNRHFESLDESVWSLVVLLTTANFPDVFLDSFSNSRWSVLYFVSFITLGTFGLVYILMATVFSQVA